MSLLLWLACNGAGSVSVEADADADADSDTDTDTDSDADTDLGPLLLSVIGDIPYDEDEVALLDSLVEQHNLEGRAAVMVHVGDIKSQASACDEQVYSSVAAQLSALTVPTLVLVGDNEWNDCPDPDEAWSFWFPTFSAFYGDLPVETQPGRAENVAWVSSGVLVVAWTMPGGAVHSEEQWADFLADGADWVEGQLQAHPEVSSAVLLTHAHPTENHDPFMDRFLPAAAAFDRPILFIHGDGHGWLEDTPWPTAPQVTRVQIEAAVHPLLVTVEGDSWTLDREPY